MGDGIEYRGEGTRNWTSEQEMEYERERGESCRSEQKGSGSSVDER